MALAKAAGALALASTQPNDHVASLLTSTNAACNQGYADAGGSSPESDLKGPLAPHSWPESYKPIRRVKFTNTDEVLEIMRPQAKDGVPLIIEGAGIIDVEKWSSLSHVGSLLGKRKVLVKRSPNSKFRYFDLKKNSGKFDFRQPVEELQLAFDEFSAESEKIFAKGLPSRMYLQETLSGHQEMAEEFSGWKWELPIRISTSCGWGLPDSNELFVGMRGAETPLHFDERENLFYQIRGLKEIVVFPYVDYPRLYPFPTTHPCDRQSMVGNPLEADLEAFPKFGEAVGHYAVLKAGDLLYLPYGWWHWLRNLEDMAISCSFWSTTPPTDLSQGVPDSFTEHMLTRVRRNLESMLAGSAPERLNETMLNLAKSLEEKQETDPVVQQVRSLLAAVKIPLDKQDKFVLDIVHGRFGIDWNKHV